MQHRQRDMRLLLILSFLLLTCANPKEEMKKLEGDEEVYSFSVKETRMGIPVWKLLAKEAVEFDRYTKIYGIKLIFYSKEGEPVSTLYADSGKVKRKTGDLSALGNVVVKGKGWKLNTTSLNWNNKKKKIWTKDEFLYEGEDGKVRGKGLESDPELKNIVIKEKYIEEGEFEE